MIQGTKLKYEIGTLTELDTAHYTDQSTMIAETLYLARLVSS